jgi:cyanophycin synthetase
MERVPARFNLLDVQGVTVVLDYGHNVSALTRLIEALEQLPHKWRSIVYSASGDRRDIDMIAQGELLGGAFDRVILYEDTYLKGRKEGEISALFREGLAKGARVNEIEEVRGGMKAVESALGACRPGDLLVIQPDIIDDAVKYLGRLIGAGAREITLDEAMTQPVKTDVGVEVACGRLGNSAFATRPFAKGDVLLHAWGPYAMRRSRHSIQVDTNLHIIPPPPLRFFNHSCAPNCGLVIRCGVEEMLVHALRPIAEGEELTLDYDTFEAEVEHIAGPCLCNAKTCRGSVVGFQGLSQKLREAYGIYVAEYLREADEAAVTCEPEEVRPILGVMPSVS